MDSRKPSNEAVSGMIEYIIISGILMVVLVIVTLSLNSTIIAGPMDQLTESAYIDIGNGISTRIVDLYVIAPVTQYSIGNTHSEGDIATIFDIPDDVVGRGYLVDVTSGETGDQIVVSGSGIERKVSLAGIGTTLGVAGSTTGAGLNRIIYNSTGYNLTQYNLP